MKRVLISFALAAGIAAPAMADLALATAKNCLGCHTVDSKRVGPAYKDVAAKYRGVKGIEDVLAAKIRNGGKDAWGPVPMPANPQVNDAEAKKLAAWILSLK